MRWSFETLLNNKDIGGICSDHLLLLHSDIIIRMQENLMFSLEQNGENLMISLEIDLERFGTHLK